MSETPPAYNATVLDDQHRYWNGRVRLYGPTEIIRWSGVDPVYQGDDLEWYGKFGKFVHKATALDDKGRLDLAYLDERILPYLLAWRKFRQDSGFKPTRIETILSWPERRLAGTVDRIGEIPGRGLVLVDIKSFGKKKSYRLQTAAYTLLAHAQKIPIQGRLCVHLQKDEKYKLDWHDDPADIPAFEALLAGFCAAVNYGFDPEAGGENNGNGNNLAIV